MTTRERALRKLRIHINNLILDIIYRLTAMGHLKETTTAIRHSLNDIDKYYKAMEEVFRK